MEMNRTRTLECQSGEGGLCPPHRQGRCRRRLVPPAPRDRVSKRYSRRAGGHGGDQGSPLPALPSLSLLLDLSLAGLLPPRLPPTANPIRNLLLGTAPKHTEGSLTQRLPANSRATGRRVAGGK